ncbi:hypothetical protein FRB99_006433, partial [Tulasnella sp. 403]
AKRGFLTVVREGLESSKLVTDDAANFIKGVATKPKTEVTKAELDQLNNFKKLFLNTNAKTPPTEGAANEIYTAFKNAQAAKGANNLKIGMGTKLSNTWSKLTPAGKVLAIGAPVGGAVLGYELLSGGGSAGVSQADNDQILSDLPKITNPDELQQYFQRVVAMNPPPSQEQMTAYYNAANPKALAALEAQYWAQVPSRCGECDPEQRTGKELASRLGFTMTGLEVHVSGGETDGMRAYKRVETLVTYTVL